MTTSVRVLGIDPAKRCGWALLDRQGARVASGVWSLSESRHEGGGMKFLRLDRYLVEVLDGHRPMAVAYEEVRRHAGVDAAHIYGGIIAAIARLCEERSIPFQGQPVGTVKKLATGKGNADKDAMIAAANARWSITVVDDNEADALWVAETLRRSL